MKKISILVVGFLLIASLVSAATVSQVYNSSTLSGQSLGISVSDGRAVTVFCDGLAGTEKATLQYNIEGTWADAYDSKGIIECTVDQNTIMIIGPGEYRIDKDTSASAVGIYIAK